MSAEVEILKEIRDAIRFLNDTFIQGFQALLAILKPQPPVASGVIIYQISSGGNRMSITGTNVGGQSTFEADALLAGVADPAGFPAGSVDTWTVDDVNVTLGPDSGPNGSQVVASVSPTDTATSYNLTVSVQMPTPSSGVAPAPLTATVNVPIIAAPPPTPNGVTITQVA
jgi:hypothetical protein